VAVWAGEASLNTTWNERAASLQTAINKYSWDSGYGAFKDNATATTLHPQDANSMAILFDVVDSPTKAESISSNLLKNWTPIGAGKNSDPIYSLFWHVSGVTRHVSRASNLEALRMSHGSWIINRYS
jgi:hypothetical protein